MALTTTVGPLIDFIVCLTMVGAAHPEHILCPGAKSSSSGSSASLTNLLSHPQVSNWAVYLSDAGCLQGVVEDLL